MIQKLRLENFKGFDRLTVEKLSQITLIGGENSAGKSSILESIFLFFDRGNAELILRQFAWRGLSRVYLSPDQLFTPIFHNYSTKERIVIALTIDSAEETLELTFSDKITRKRISYEKRIRGTSIQIRTDEKPVVNAKMELNYSKSKGATPERSELLITAKGLTLRDENAAVESRQTIYVSPRNPSSPAEDAQRFGELDARSEVDKAVDFLKGFDPRIKGLSAIFYGDSSVLHADVGLPRKVPVPHLGEGLAFLLSTFLAISHARNGTFLIDEIGNGIHHSLLPKLWVAIGKAAKEFSCQVIATTHSYECISAAAKGVRNLFEPEFTYIRLDRKAHKTTPTSYSFPAFEAALESGWEVR